MVTIETTRPRRVKDCRSHRQHEGLLAARRLVRGFDEDDRRKSVLRLSTAGHAVYTHVAPLTGHGTGDTPVLDDLPGAPITNWRTTLGIIATATDTEEIGE
jgi:hypothetical protein